MNSIRAISPLSVVTTLCVGLFIALSSPESALAAARPDFARVHDSLANSSSSVLSALHLDAKEFAFFGDLTSTHDHDLNNGSHFCGTDFTSEASRAALKKYAEDRALGLYPIARKGSFTPSAVGDERSFNVQENGSSVPLQFRLVEVTDLYNLWVEIGEIDNGNVSASIIASFRQRALISSPSRSIDPSKGFFANNHTVYGLPPNVDGDGLVDVLMYDIGSVNGAAGVTVLGYVSPSDLVIGSGTNTGNERDILYLDSNEGTRNFTTLAAVAAHEYTHLIHLAYGGDETFLSEGYAEYASDFNGYFWRSTTYPSIPGEVSLPLFTWRSDNANVIRDYERAGLFMTYLGERAGTLAVGEMLRGVNKKGAVGIDSVLSQYGQNLADAIRDFHTANFFNDRSIDPKFGYEQPERSAHHAALTSAPINGEIMSTVGEGGFFDTFYELVQAGSVRYRRYNSVSDMVVKYDVPVDPIFGAATQAFARSRNSGRMVFKRAGSTVVEFVDMPPSQSYVTLQGRFEWVLFIFVQNNPAGIGDKTRFEASWIPLSMATDTEEESEFPTQVELGTNFPNPFNPQTTVPISLPATQPVQLEVFDLLGKRMTTLFDGILPAGNHSFTLAAGTWPTGSYVVRLISEGHVESRLITLLK